MLPLELVPSMLPELLHSLECRATVALLTMSCCPALLAVRFINPTNPWLPLLSPAQLVEINTSFIKFGACHSV